MQITSTRSDITQIAGDALVVGLHSDTRLGPHLTRVNEAVGGIVAELVDRKEIKGKLAEVTQLWSPLGIAARQLIVVGLGDRARFGQGPAGQAAGAAAKLLAAKPLRKVVFAWEQDWDDDAVASGICAAAVGCAGQDLYRAEKKLTPFAEMLWWGASEAALATGEILADSINFTRRLVNEPPSTLTPARFAEEAVGLAELYGLPVEVWDETRLAAERCGALLGVARGSAHPPRLVIVRYHGDPSRDTVGLIGKGVTFDSGGYSLKPTDSMKTMKCDMAGAATVLGAVIAMARLKLPVNVTGYMGMVENMVSGDSYKLGDVLTARSGKTIEIHNTDAEGRLVLADVIHVAVEQGVARMIDLATLTGACVVALGTDVTGLMTNDQRWCDALLAAGQQTGERMWQLPMFEEFDEQIVSSVADIKNVGEGRWGGAITAAKFLEQFVADRPWVHCDIAGPAFAEKPKAWIDAGASGAMLRSLVQLLR